jgi:DNA/RNA-binding domain of Phe-tRNA-synthetase-like protein
MKYLVTQALRDMGIQHSVAAQICGLEIPETYAELNETKKAAVEEAMQLSEEEFANDEILLSYRKLVQATGRSLKKFPPAAENLIEQVRRVGRLPIINAAVDAYNTVVVKRRLALGVHDRAKVGDVIHFRLSDGGESFTAVGQSKVKLTQPGDFVYADCTRVLAWFDSKDSDEAKVSRETTDIVLIIQGTPLTTRDYNRAAAVEASELIVSICGGKYEIVDF